MVLGSDRQEAGEESPPLNKLQTESKIADMSRREGQEQKKTQHVDRKPDNEADLDGATLPESQVRRAAAAQLSAAVRATVERFEQADASGRSALLTREVRPAILGLVGLLREASKQPEPSIATAASRCLSDAFSEKEEASERVLLTVKQAAKFLKKSVPLIQHQPTRSGSVRKSGTSICFRRQS